MIHNIFEVDNWKLKLLFWNLCCTFPKVAWRSTSRLLACPRIFRLFMKGKFDSYVLWPLSKRVQNWTIDGSTACNFTVIQMNSSEKIRSFHHTYSWDSELETVWLNLICWPFRTSTDRHKGLNQILSCVSKTFLAIRNWNL